MTTVAVKREDSYTLDDKQLSVKHLRENASKRILNELTLSFGSPPTNTSDSLPTPI